MLIDCCQVRVSIKPVNKGLKPIELKGRFQGKYVHGNLFLQKFLLELRFRIHLILLGAHYVSNLKM